MQEICLSKYVDSLLDNAPNKLVGCVIQKRYYSVFPSLAHCFGTCSEPPTVSKQKLGDCSNACSDPI